VCTSVSFARSQARLKAENALSPLQTPVDGRKALQDELYWRDEPINCGCSITRNSLIRPQEHWIPRSGRVSRYWATIEMVK
jgi:hypothetical protein